MLASATSEEDAHKIQQGAFYDEHSDDGWEIERPAGAPRFHRWLLREKFRKAIKGVGLPLRNATVLVICGGSGMDAEFLASEGAVAITSDLALGTALRAAERARRSSTGFTSIVADAERLPFQDRSVDIVYVHDGLHHLEDPELGLAEMCRVARVGVMVSEPARASLTRLAVMCGIAQEIEDAGNVVARLETDRMRSFLGQQGFGVARCARYAMFYRHHPGLPTRVLSAPGLFEFAVVGFRIANAVLGRIGNKLVVVGVRR